MTRAALALALLLLAGCGGSDRIDPCRGCEAYRFSFMSRDIPAKARVVRAIPPGARYNNVCFAVNGPPEWRNYSCTLIDSPRDTVWLWIER